MSYCFTLSRASALGALFLPGDSFAVGWERARAIAKACGGADAPGYLDAIEGRAFETVSRLAFDDFQPLMVEIVASEGKKMSPVRPFARAALGNRTDMVWVCAALSARCEIVRATSLGTVDVGRHRQACPHWDIVLNKVETLPAIAEMSLAAWAGSTLSSGNPAVLSVRGGERAYQLVDALADGFLFSSGCVAAIDRGFDCFAG